MGPISAAVYVPLVHTKNQPTNRLNGLQEKQVELMAASIKKQYDM